MTSPQPSLNLTIRLTPEQLGFLAYLYPNDDVSGQKVWVKGL